MTHVMEPLAHLKQNICTRDLPKDTERSNSMISSKLSYFLYFITCGLMEAFGHRDHEQETQVQQLDTIVVEDEESRRRSQYMSHSKSTKQNDYDVNGVRDRGIRYWFRRNKIVPAVLPTARGGRSGATCASGQCTINEISEDEPVENSNDHVVLAFSETKDSFLRRQTGAQALQSFATCARLNENFMRTIWMGVDNRDKDDNTTDTQETASNSSFSSKITTTWKAFRQRISFRGIQRRAESELCCGNKNISDAQENLAGNTGVERKFKGKKGRISGKYCRGKSMKNSSTTTKTEPVRSHKPRDNNSTFNRDLYMQINNLVVTEASGQCGSSDPFRFPEEISELSALPLEYLDWRTNVKCDS